MVTRAVILLAIIAVARSASVGEHVTCCGPTQWESLAMASAVYGYETASMSMSGRLSVDHVHKLAALSLVRTMDATMNTTMVMSAHDSSMYIYFITEHHRQAQEQQHQCVAYVLNNIIADLSSSCFPASQSSMPDRLKSQAPMNVLAYEYAGLAGLFAVQIAANADDCSPSMFSMFTGASNGPQLNIMLSNVNSGKSDQSADHLIQVACSNVAPMNIMVPDNGRFSNREGPMDSMRSSSNNADPQQWIADMVTMYIVQMIGADVSSRGKRDLRDMLIAHDEKSQPSAVEILKSAMAMKYLMQNMSDFVRPVSRNVSANKSASVDNVLDWLIVQDLITSLMSRKSRDGVNRMGDSNIDADNVMSWIVKQKLVSRHQEPDLSDVVYAMLKQKMISNLMSGDSNHDDSSNDHSREGKDGSDTFNILINQHIISSEDTITSEDDTRDSANIEALVSWLIKQKLGPAMAVEGITSHRDDSRNSLPAIVLANAKMNQDDSENGHLPNLAKLMSLKSQLSHDGRNDDSSSNIEDLLTSMVKNEVKSSVMNGKSRNHGPQRHKRDLRDMMNKRSHPGRDEGLRNDGMVRTKDIIGWMMQELMPTMTRNTNDSRKLDLWDVNALMNKKSEPSHDDSKNNERRDDDDSINIDDVVEWMIKQEILSSLTHSRERNNGLLDVMNKHREPSHSGRPWNDDSINVNDIITWVIEQAILSNVMPSNGHRDGPQRHKRDLWDAMALVNKQSEENHGMSKDDGRDDSRDDVGRNDDDSINIDDIIMWMIKQEILSNVMPKGHRDGPQRHKRDLWDAMALMNKQSEENHGMSKDDGRDDSRDDVGRKDDDSINIDDIIMWMIKQEILSNVMPKGHRDGSQRHKRDLWDAMALMNKQSEENHGMSKDDGRDDSRDDVGRNDDDSINIDDIIMWMIKQGILSNVMPKGHRDGPQRHKRDLWDAMALVNKQSEENHGMSKDDGRDDSRDDVGRNDDDSINIDDIITWMIKQEILSNVMPKGHRDGPQRNKRDLWDVMALMNKQSEENHWPSRDDEGLFDSVKDDREGDLSHDGDDRIDDSSDMDDLIASMIKQSHLPKNKSH